MNNVLINVLFLLGSFGYVCCLWCFVGGGFWFWSSGAFEDVLVYFYDCYGC